MTNIIPPLLKSNYLLWSLALQDIAQFTLLKPHPLPHITQVERIEPLI